jgi:hypothetical protein
MSNSINKFNFKEILEKIFAHLEFILQKVLLGIKCIDVSKESKNFLQW